MMTRQTRQKGFIQLMLITVSVLLVFQLVFVALNSNNRKVAVQPVEAATEQNWFDGVLNLVRGESASIITDNIPSMAGFVCSHVVSYFVEKNNNEKFIAEVNKVNERVKEVQQELKNIINMINEQNADAKKRDSRNTLDSFFNVVDTLTATIGPIYAGYDNIATREQNGELDKENAVAEEERFYNNNLKNMVFGNGTSTGSLYLQLTTFMDKIVQPSRTQNETLMEHYFTTYEHLWAFEMQSFAPKEEFLGYVMSALTEGINLYTFQSVYELNVAKSNEDTAQQTILESRWTTFKQKADAATAYIKKEVTALDKAKAESKETNSTLHYASGSKVSKNLFVGSVSERSNNFYTYLAYYRISKSNNKAGCVFTTLNSDKFMSQILQEYKNYKTNYRKDSSFTLSDFLKEIGFKSDNWDVAGFYRKQSFTRSVNENYRSGKWEFFINYYDNSGNEGSMRCYGAVAGGIAERGRSRAGITYEALNTQYLSFVLSSGVMVGSYNNSFDSRDDYNVICPSLELVDALYSCSRMYSDYSSQLGKVW